MITGGEKGLGMVAGGDGVGEGFVECRASIGRTGDDGPGGVNFFWSGELRAMEVVPLGFFGDIGD